MEIDHETLKKIAESIQTLLKDEYDITAHKLTLTLLVDKDFYDKIKDNFPDRHPSDLTIAEAEKDWAVMILWSKLLA